MGYPPQGAVGAPYSEASVSGATVNAYTAVADLDWRGIKNGRVVIHNTHGANHLDWKLQARYANYATGADDDQYIDGQIDHELGDGDGYVIPIETGFSRLKVLVRSTVAAAHATYRIEYLENK